MPEKISRELFARYQEQKRLFELAQDSMYETMEPIITRLMEIYPLLKENGMWTSLGTPSSDPIDSFSFDNVKDTITVVFKLETSREIGFLLPQTIDAKLLFNNSLIKALNPVLPKDKKQRHKMFLILKKEFEEDETQRSKM